MKQIIKDFIQSMTRGAIEASIDMGDVSFHVTPEGEDKWKTRVFCETGVPEIGPPVRYILREETKFSVFFIFESITDLEAGLNHIVPQVY